MTDEFVLNLAETEYKITAEYDVDANTVKVYKDGTLVADKSVVWRLNSFFAPIVLGEDTVVFVCLERSFKGWFNALFKRSASYSFDLFVDQKSVKDSTPITRAKDKASEAIEKGFISNSVHQLKWTLPLSVAIVGIPQLITILLDRFTAERGYFLYALLMVATTFVWVVLFSAISWLRLALIEEKWGKLFN